MNRLLIMLVGCLVSPIAAAAELSVTPGEKAIFPLRLPYLRETMIVLPDKVAAITGASLPAFQVEPVGPEQVMLRALQPNGVGNLFVSLADKTLVTFDLQTVTTGGEKLVQVVHRPKASEAKITSMPLEGAAPLLTGKWSVQKMHFRGKGNGLAVTVNYALTTRDHLILNCTLTNTGEEPFAVSAFKVLLVTLGGLKGTSVDRSEPVPTSMLFPQTTISAGEEVSGSLVLPSLALDHDQGLFVQVLDAQAQGPEVLVTL